MYNPGNGFPIFLHEFQQSGARSIVCVDHLYQSQTNGN